LTEQVVARDPAHDFNGDALDASGGKFWGDRLIMMHRGQIIHDFQGAEKTAPAGRMICSLASKKCDAPEQLDEKRSRDVGRTVQSERYRSSYTVDCIA